MSGPWIWRRLTRLLLLPLLMEEEIRHGRHNPKVPYHTKLTLCVQPVIGQIKNMKEKDKTAFVSCVPSTVKKVFEVTKGTLPCIGNR